MKGKSNDSLIIDLLRAGRIRVNPLKGLVYSVEKDEPIGTINYAGYLIACLRWKGARANIRIHRVIYVSQFGEIPDGYEINHLNGNKIDNRICNLEAVTMSENMHHASVNGLRGKAGWHLKKAQRIRGRFMSKDHPDFIPYSDYVPREVPTDDKNNS